jgi:hypothetical protein
MEDQARTPRYAMAQHQRRTVLYHAGACCWGKLLGHVAAALSHTCPVTWDEIMPVRIMAARPQPCAVAYNGITPVQTKRLEV